MRSLKHQLKLFAFGVGLLASQTLVFSTQAASPIKTATFAGGCFWCMEPPFDKLKGVVDTTVGYTGGHVKNPSYKQVSRGGTGHTEAIQVKYDASKVSYNDLLKVFWRQIDPTVKDRQFVDVGSQYRTGIFYHSQTQYKLALASKRQLEKTGPFKKPIVTEISPLKAFYKAEDYHQNYYITHPYRYKLYRFNSGRDQYLDAVWGKGNH